MRAIVLFHGYNLNATGLHGIRMKDGTLATYPHRDWEAVCVGEGNRKGRLRTALELVRDFRPLHVIFSTGCTWMPYEMSEARYSYQRAVQLADEYDITKANLERVAVFDEESTNTSGTISAVAEWFRKGRFGSEPTYLMHVASSNHSPRVVRDTVKGPFEDLPFVTHMFVPAETAYGGGHPKDTIVDDLGQSYLAKKHVREVLDNYQSSNGDVLLHDVKSALGL